MNDKSIDDLNKKLEDKVTQFAVFYSGQDNIYALDICKIKAFTITDSVKIVNTPSDSDVIVGTATIRETPVTLLNFDNWIGDSALNTSDYKLIIYCNFEGKELGILIKDMLNIFDKKNSELTISGNEEDKILASTYVKINEENNLCSVFNFNKLLLDICFKK